MSKKHKRKFSAKRHGNSPGQIAQSTAQSDTMSAEIQPIHDAQRPAPQSAATTSASVGYVAGELYRIAILFSILILLLVGVVITSRKTSYLDTISQHLSNLLHIQE